jgi:hypothetical protein
VAVIVDESAPVADALRFQPNGVAARPEAHVHVEHLGVVEARFERAGA